jgi:DNA-binding response OmpR family regulator
MITLARSKGAVVRHATLMRDVWGADKNMGTVHTFVSYLRAKLERGGESPLVHTVHGVGYALRSSAS